MRQKVELSAVRDKDLRGILDHFHLSERMDNAELLCNSCSEIITWDNLGALLVKEGTLILVCHLSECIGEATATRS